MQIFKLKYSLYFILVFLLYSNFGISQQQKFDSLKKLLNTVNLPEKKATLLVDIAKSIYYSIPDSSIAYCEQAEKISKLNNLEVQLAYSLHCECRYILLKGDVKTTLEKLNQAIVLFEKNNEQNGLAKCYSLKSIALNRIDKKDEALDYLLKAKSIYLKLNNKESLSTILHNLTDLYIQQNKLTLASNSLNELKTLNLPKSGNDFYTEINAGRIQYNQKNYSEAISNFVKGTSIAHEYKMLDSEISGLTRIAESYYELNNNTEAQKYFQEAINLAVVNHLMVEEKDALNGVLRICEKEKNYSAAFFTLKKIKVIEDSLLNSDKLKSINDIEHKLVVTQKEKIITEQALSLEKEKVALASSKNNTLLLIAGLVIIGIAFLFLFYFNSKTKKLFALIKQQKIEVEAQKEIIEIKNKDVMDSIHYAKYIQGSMLPSTKTMNSFFPDNFILYKPKDVVAGDFYWTETINGNPIIAVCDCTGHGVPGAMVSIVACNALNRAINEFKLTNPALIFDKVNALMQETFSKSDYDVSDGMDGVLCSIDYNAMQLNIAAANNPIWIVSKPSINTNLWEEPWQLSQISPDKQPIGKFRDEITNFNLKTITIQKGEMIYLFSDGYADQFGGPKGKKFKYKQLQGLLCSIAKLPLSEQQSALNTSIENWKGNLDQVDDILIIGIRV